LLFLCFAFELAYVDSGFVWLKNQTTSCPLKEASRDLDHLRCAIVPGLPTLGDLVGDCVEALKIIAEHFDYAFGALHTATPSITITITYFKEKAYDNKHWQMVGSLMSVSPEHALLYMAVKKCKAALKSACQLADRSFTLNAMYAGLPKIILDV
jgi:hypothetical protein